MSSSDSSQSEDSIRVHHVDDETNQLWYAKTFIEISDPVIHMESANTPEEALAKIAKESYDCIVTDYQMPKMDGIELAQRIRKLSDVPIIIYTGRGSEEVAEVAFEMGVTDYIRKEVQPAHYQVLARRIRSAVERKRAQREVKRSEARLRSFMDSATDYFYLYNSELKLEDINEAGMTIFPPGTDRDDVIGKNLLELVPGLEENGRFEVYKSVVETGDAVFFDEVRLHPSVGDIHLAIKAFRVEGGLGILCFNITDRKKYEEKLTALHGLAVQLNKAEDYDEIWDSILEATETILGFDYFGIFVTEDGTLREIKSRGLPVIDFTIPLSGKGLTVKAVNEKTTIRINDVRGNPDFVQGSLDTRSEMVVPVFIDDEVYAVFNVESEDLDAFSENDQKLLETLTMHVSSSLSRLKSLKALRASEEK